MKLHINEHTTIKKVKFINDKIIEITKHGIVQPYKEFKGVLNKQNVTGLVCLNDDNVYQLKTV